MKVVHLVCALLVFITFLESVSGANILFFFGASTYSHNLCVWPLAEALADKGHIVTFFSSHAPKSKHPKIIEVCPKILQEKDFAFHNKEVNLLDLRYAGVTPYLWKMILYPVGINLTERILTDPESLDWIKNSKFDLVIVDNFFNDVGIGLAYKFKAPYIIFGTTATFMWEYDEFGLHAETSWIPDMQKHYPENMSFYEKIMNTIQPIKWSLGREWYFLPKVENLLRKALNMPDMPPLKELHKEVGVVLMNMHYSEEYARSLPPLVVSVGGIHCKNSTNNALPNDLESFIQKDVGGPGFIYAAFGSALKFSQFPDSLQKIFINAMKNSKVKFVLKWDGSKIPANFPKNVYTADWLPQQDLLAHPKALGFMTHGGLLGINEAVYHGVPVIVFPTFAEQDYNAERVQNGGYGIRLEITQLTQSILESSIQKLLEDPSYKTKMLQVSKVFHDRPQPPLDLAVWWTEFVLRHKKTPFLKPKSIHQTWYQRRLLDVWGFLFFAFMSIFSLGVYIIFKVFQKCVTFKKVSDRKKHKSSVKKSK